MSYKSETLEPNVVTPQKEIETFSITRKDVQKISKAVLEELGDDVINQAIADGKIEIPAGGTKLYKHAIEFNLRPKITTYELDGTSSSTTPTYAEKKLYIISFKSNYESVGALTNDIKNGNCYIIKIVSGTNEYSLFVSLSETDELRFKCKSIPENKLYYGLSLARQNGTSFSIVSDTVTEL